METQMKKKIESKIYIYNRDGMTCYYCKKDLHINKTTMDHYYPKSLGGTLDVYNVVTCCKRCNSYKKSRVPEDWKAINIRLFTQGVVDGKIVAINHSKAEHTRIVDLVNSVDEVSVEPMYTVFSSKTHRFSVKQNKIYLIEVR